MGTCNFWNHENGIYVVEQLAEEEVIENILENIANNESEEALKEAKDLLAEDEEEFKHVHNFWDEYSFYDGIYLEDALYNIEHELKEKGYTVVREDNYSIDIYNAKDKWVARIYPESGYYDGYQIIVDTDGWERFADYYDTQTELFEQFTPNHKRVLKVVAEYTTPIGVVGVFSNGEAVYEKL